MRDMEETSVRQVEGFEVYSAKAYAFLEAFDVEVSPDFLAKVMSAAESEETTQGELRSHIEDLTTQLPSKQREPGFPLAATSKVKFLLLNVCRKL